MEGDTGRAKREEKREREREVRGVVVVAKNKGYKWLRRQ
jgi:hypothetical protein